jgi:hypothetical protein
VLIFLLDGRRQINHHSSNIVEEVLDLTYKNTACVLNQYGFR